MNVSTNNLGNQVLEVIVEIAPEDYQAAVEGNLIQYQRTAVINGFRKGKAPRSLINRIYGESTLAKAVDDVHNQAIREFLEGEGAKYDLLGTLFLTSDSPRNEYKQGNTFTFKYNIAIVEMNPFEVSKDDVLTEYSIIPSPENVKVAEESILTSWGGEENADEAGENDTVVVDLKQGENVLEEVRVLVSKVAGEAHSHFLGAHPGDSFEVNVNEAFENETDRAAILDVKKEELEGIDPLYTVSVVKVLTFVPATSCQETWDKIFGEGKVTSEEQWQEAVLSYAKGPYIRQTSSVFATDARKYFLDKADVKVNADMIRLIIETNRKESDKEELTDEMIAGEIEYIKWDRVKNSILDQFSQGITENDLKASAEAYMDDYFSSYGLPHEFIAEQAEQFLKNEENRGFIERMASDNKVFGLIHSNVTIQTEELTPDQFSDKFAPKTEEKEEEDPAVSE